VVVTHAPLAGQTFSGRIAKAAVTATRTTIAAMIRAAACILRTMLNAMYATANRAGGDALRKSAGAGIRMN